MSDDMEVKQELGTPEKINGKEDRFKDFDVDKAILAEFQAYDNEITDKLKSALEGLTQAKIGAGYRNAEDGLLAFNMSLTKLVKYGIKTGKLYHNIEFDSGVKAVAGYSAELESWGRCKALGRISSSIAEFCDSISDMVQNQMFKLAYAMIRMNEELPHLSDIYTKIIYGFNEYNNLRVYYGNAEIIKEIKLHKNTPPEENYQIAKGHLDNYIDGTKHLTTLLASGGINDLVIIDRITSAFQKIYLAKDSMKGYIDKARKILGDYDKLMEPGPYIKYEYHNLNHIREVLESIIELFEIALKLIDEYVNESAKPPYAFMHYDSTVKETADRWLAESLPDPLTNGTRYGNLIKSIQKSWDSILRPIAKNAAKWGLD